MGLHPPHVNVEIMVKAGIHTAQGGLLAIRGQAWWTDDNVPTIIWINTVQLDFVTYIKSPFELMHAYDGCAL